MECDGGLPPPQLLLLLFCHSPKPQPRQPGERQPHPKPHIGQPIAQPSEWQPEPQLAAGCVRGLLPDNMDFLNVFSVLMVI